MLDLPSIEQRAVIDTISKGNVVVQAVAGSGKTTTVLHVAKTYPDMRILMLTFSARLKQDTRKRASHLGLSNLEAHSYHAFCVAYLDESTTTDQGIRNMLKMNTLPTRKPACFDLLVLDETQDMSPLYYKLILRIHSELCTFKHILILGDPRQSIFDFNNADSRFVTCAEELFSINSLPWARKTLSTSYRVTRPMATFVNECVLGFSLIQAIRPGENVQYIICDAFRAYCLIEEVLELLIEGYEYQDIFVLAPSVRPGRRTPVQFLANAMSDKNIPIHVSNDEEVLSDKSMHGKVVFSSYHQVKGLERKVVIVFGFDASYFKYYAKDADQSVCPNAMHVALTRARERLILVHHYQSGPLPFLKQDIDSFAKVYVDRQLDLQVSRPAEDVITPPIGVTDLLRHTPEDVLDTCVSLFQVTKSTEFLRPRLHVTQEIRQGTLYENVADINGVAIHMYFALRTEGNLFLHKALVDGGLFRKDSELPAVQKILSELNEYVNDAEQIIADGMHLSVRDLLRLCNYFNCVQNGLVYRARQIQTYNWMDEAQLHTCSQRLVGKVRPNATHERQLKCNVMGRSLIGFVDCEDISTVWEYKCTNELKAEHLLQLGLYMFLHKIERSEKCSAFLERLQAYDWNWLGETNETLTLLGELQSLLIFRPKQKYTVKQERHEITIHRITGDGHVRYTVKGSRKHCTRTDHEMAELVHGDRLRILYNQILDVLYPQKQYKLYNILTDEEWTIDANFEDLKKMVALLFDTKFGVKSKICDSEFLREMQQVRRVCLG